jgi:hypothetical protein
MRQTYEPSIGGTGDARRPSTAGASSSSSRPGTAGSRPSTARSNRNKTKLPSCSSVAALMEVGTVGAVHSC